MHVNLSPDIADCTGCEGPIDSIDTNYISFYIHRHIYVWVIKIPQALSQTQSQSHPFFVFRFRANTNSKLKVRAKVKVQVRVEKRIISIHHIIYGISSIHPIYLYYPFWFFPRHRQHLSNTHLILFLFL